MKKVTFVHGWGEDPRIWDRTVSQLKDIQPYFIDLGFIKNDVEAEKEIPEDSFVVGHSLGVLWALKNLPTSTKGLVSICGFDRFTSFVPARVLKTMQKNLETDPYSQMTGFWQQAGAGEYASEEDLNIEPLKQGLEWLKSLDAEKELLNLDMPILVIASQDDKIVPFEASQRIWNKYKFKYVENGGHMLPLKKPEFCAEYIQNFLNEYV